MSMSGNRHQIGGLDFVRLCETFSQICPDFCETSPQNNEKSQSLDFANKILFEVGPRMRNVRKSGSNQMWRLVFNGGQSIYVYTYTFQRPINQEPCVRDNKLYLTLKQAGLLAVRKLCSLLPDVHNPRDKFLMTPLSLAVFAPESIPKIAKALSQLLGTSVQSGVVAKAVISSCQTDGFHLPHSQCHIALVAIEATVQLAEERQKLRAFTLKRYAKCGKPFDEAQHNVYLQYSKMPARTEELLPSPTPAVPPKKLNVSEVLRSIVKSTDDPLSGGTLDMKFVALKNNADHTSRGEESNPVEIRIEGINLNGITTKLLTKKV